MSLKEAKGWEIAARSWAGQLRIVGPGDIAAVLTLDRATLADYPGGIATRHEPQSLRFANSGHVAESVPTVPSQGPVVLVGADYHHRGAFTCQ